MPIYLVHGFQWPRILIRQHTANFDIDDCAPDWVHMGSPSSTALLDSLHHLYPSLMESLDSEHTDIQLIEEYSQTEASAMPKNFVYVCDRVKRLEGCSLDVGDTAGREWGLGDGPDERMVKLRDELAAGAKVGLWLVCCDDETRLPPVPGKDGEGGTEEGYGRNGESNGRKEASDERRTEQLKSLPKREKPLPTPPASTQRPKGVSLFFTNLEFAC